MDKITTVGIDLAKRVFALHRADASGRVVPRKTIRARAVHGGGGQAPAVSDRHGGVLRVTRMGAAQLYRAALGGTMGGASPPKNARSLGGYP